MDDRIDITIVNSKGASKIILYNWKIQENITAYKVDLRSKEMIY